MLEVLTTPLHDPPSTTNRHDRPQLYIRIEYCRSAYSTQDSALADNIFNPSLDASTLDSWERAFYTRLPNTLCCNTSFSRACARVQPIPQSLSQSPNDSNPYAFAIYSSTLNCGRTPHEVPISADKNSSRIGTHFRKQTLNAVTLFGTENGASFGNMIWSLLSRMIAFPI